VRLDTRQEKAQLAAAEAQGDLTRLNLERARGLRAEGVIAQADLDRAIAESAQAEARVGEIRATIERKTVHAPFGGILGIRQVTVGQYRPGRARFRRELRALRSLRVRRGRRERAERRDLPRRAAAVRQALRGARRPGGGRGRAQGRRGGRQLRRLQAEERRRHQGEERRPAPQQPGAQARGQLMRFTDLFIKRPVLAVVVNLVILIAGLQAIRSLSVRQYPRSDITVIRVATAYVGANADLVRGFITTPLERVIASA